jgi:hypothetical protein
MASLYEHGVEPDRGDGYPAQWRQYRLRRTLALASLMAWPAVCIGLFLLSRVRFHMPLLALVLMFAWLALTAGFIYWAGEFRCPRCCRRFGAQGNRRSHNYTRGLFDRACSNCRLRRYEL